MWAIAATPIRRWLLLAAAVPSGAATARALARRIEERRGRTRVSGGLRRLEALLERGSRHGRRRRAR